MHTIVLRNRPRKTPTGNTFTIDIIGESPVVESVRATIQGLEHHPAKAARRSLIDMLAIIEKHNFQIRFTEHFDTEDELEAWSFVLQG